MQKTILYIAASLDGFIAGKNDDISWLDPFNSVDYDFDKFMKSIGMVIEGRRTYDLMIKNGYEFVHPVPEIIMTHRRLYGRPQKRGVVFAAGSPGRILGLAKKMTKKDIWIGGGADIACKFINAGLVDEIILTIIPVFVGEGILLFKNMNKNIVMTLKEVSEFGKGMVQLVYGLKLKPVRKTKK